MHFIRTAPLQLGTEKYLSDKLIFRTDIKDCLWILSTVYIILNKKWRIKPVFHVILTSQKIINDYKSYEDIEHFN